MANKKTKETVYRDKDNQRWRYLKDGGINGVFSGMWCMVRIKDGHRTYIKVEDLTVEK